MKPRLKKLSRQVVVITGATSGIGLVTARKAAQKGAKLVLGARNKEALKELEREFKVRNCDCVVVETDVGDEEQIHNLAKKAVSNYGAIDTWINNAGVSIYGRLVDVPIADERRLFETNFWGQVYGSLAAVEHMKEHGGAIINVGSIVSDRAIPLQGIYSASKHAVKGFTDSLRMELEQQGVPISVTLIKPAAIDTPYTSHAKNYMDKEPSLPPPVYAPDIVADAILRCAEHPEREVFVGGAGKAMIGSSIIAPRLTDAVMKKMTFKQQQSNEARTDRKDNLYKAGEDLSERGKYEGRVFETGASGGSHPVLRGMAALGLGAAIFAFFRGEGEGRGASTYTR